MTDLPALARKWTTDKALYYAPYYDSIFSDRRESVRKVLEFGIGSAETMMQPASRIGSRYYITGASLFMWEEYFPNARIFALDNNERILINSGRINSFKCSQADQNSYAYAIKNVGRDFDIIIDDGSHAPADQLLCARTLVPLVKPGGFYITEDATPGDDKFLAQYPYPHEAVDFGIGTDDPARLVVVRR